MFISKLTCSLTRDVRNRSKYGRSFMKWSCVFVLHWLVVQDYDVRVWHILEASLVKCYMHLGKSIRFNNNYITSFWLKNTLCKKRKEFYLSMCAGKASTEWWKTFKMTKSKWSDLSSRYEVQCIFHVSSIQSSPISFNLKASSCTSVDSISSGLARHICEGQAPVAGSTIDCWSSSSDTGVMCE